MSTMRARPRHSFSWGFDLDCEGASLASFDMHWLREGGQFTWEGREYRLLREKAWSGHFLLAADQQVLARATKESIVGRRFAVQVEDRRFTLHAVSCFSRRFELIERGAVVGSVVPDHLFTRACTVDWPQDLSVPVQVFLFWLVALMWRREANAAGAS